MMANDRARIDRYIPFTTDKGIGSFIKRLSRDFIVIIADLADSILRFF